MSRVSVFTGMMLVYVWRRRNERYDRRCVMPVRAHNGGSVMVWGCISMIERTDLEILPPPAITSIRYVNDILRPHVLPLRRLHPNLVYMQDNARPHTANIARSFFE